jgi:hypothetical protein
MRNNAATHIGAIPSIVCENKRLIKMIVLGENAPSRNGARCMLEDEHNFDQSRLLAWSVDVGQ